MNANIIPNLILLVLLSSVLGLFLVVAISISGLSEKRNNYKNFMFKVDEEYVQKKLAKIQDECEYVVSLKVLEWSNAMNAWISPMRGNPWYDGQLYADEEPIYGVMEHGIHTSKTFSKIQTYMEDNYSRHLFVVGLLPPVDDYEDGYLSGGAFIINKIV